MTKEEKALLLLEVYNQETDRLKKEVLSQKAELFMSNSSDSADEDLQKINDYYELEKGRIERRFLRAICALEG